MGRDRVRVPAGLEPLDEIARRHHVDAALADALDRPGVDARDIGDGALRRVLHREPPAAAQQGVEPGGERLASCVDQLLAGQLVEIVRFDRVHQLPRLPVAGIM